MTLELSRTPATAHDRTCAIGMDLSTLGAEVFDGASDFGEDFPVESCNMSRLAALAGAGLNDGLASVLLGPTFRLRSDTHLRESWLDAVQAATKLAPRLTGPITAAVIADEYVLSSAIDLVTGTGVGLELHRVRDMAALEPLLERARAENIDLSIALTGSSARSIDADAVGRLINWVRLREPDPHIARELRYQLRDAANAQQRDLRIVADLFIIISACEADAQERAQLIDSIGADRYAKGAPRVLGTVHDVADHIESWLALSAADAFTLLPGSLPTDLASTVRGVLPELSAREQAIDEGGK